MKYGKKVCQTLKEVRKQIADANEIPYEITECHHEGNCSGTCPKCESEVRYIENQLSLRRAAGKAISLVGISLGVSAIFASCASSSNTQSSANQSQAVEECVEDEINEANVLPGEVVIINTGTVEPEFPGGEEALMKFIKDNLKFPSECDAQGRVTLSFTIGKDGSISKIKVMRSPHDALSEEAIRIVKLMPKWKPGRIRGKKTKSKYVLPITFHLE